MLAHLFNAPPEILQKIAFFACLGTPLGPPHDLYNLTLVCRASHKVLSPSSARLYMDIFAQKFDVEAPKCRLGVLALQDNAKTELQRRFAALKSFRTGDLDESHLTEAFWIAYLMFEDSDTSQKNVKQLLWAGLPNFLDNFLRKRLYEGSMENNGWPLPNERNSLAIALFWLTSSQSSVNREPRSLRNEMMQLLGPFVFAAFRYPIFTTAEHCFDLAKFGTHSRVNSIHGPYPPSSLLLQEVVYFGRVMRIARIPSAPLFASLSYFTRHETIEPVVPPHLIEANRQTRERANALGEVGPTIDDVVHFIHKCRTRFTGFPSVDIGAQHKHFNFSPSLTLGQPSLYKLGTLTGRWQGSCIMPFMEDYRKWVEELSAPPDFPATGRSPLYVTLQEHFTRDHASVLPQNGTDEGTINAWLPSGCQWVEKPNGIEAFDKLGKFKAFYETFRPGRLSSEYNDIADVIITGKTDDRHAAAWGAFHILGRIRLSDGLMVLSRESLAGAGTSLLRGYVTSSQNLIGRLKHVSNGAEPAYWEATFSLCKDQTTVQAERLVHSGIS